MKPILYITDPKILAIPIIECHEPMIDITNKAEIHYGEAPECALTENCYRKMRKTVFIKLCEAQSDLPKGWRFKLYEGFRSLAVQKMLFDQELQRVRARSAHLSTEQQFYEATHLVSPVINFDGSINIPPHNTGAAVDVEIIESATGKLINMGMLLKDWVSVKPELCITDYADLDNEAKQNRKILLEIMQAHGFVNYPSEWWHYSYGDRYWAYHQDKSHAIYASADTIEVES